LSYRPERVRERHGVEQRQKHKHKY